MSSVGPSVIDQISASLSRAGLQHEVIASNIANRDTEGYQRLKVRFDAAMERAGEVTVDADSAGTDVSLEQDLVALSSSSAQYAALARVLNRYFAIIGSITSYSRS